MLMVKPYIRKRFQGSQPRVALLRTKKPLIYLLKSAELNG